jgi:N-acetylated-alpha-linked acidic dipeptidase
MLEAVHGVGELLKSGWRPKRTIVFASWDAEEEGLMGSTEWGEQHEKELANADAYFNLDVAVSGSKFGASAVPSLKQFIRDAAKVVSSPKGGTVYDAWKQAPTANQTQNPTDFIGEMKRQPAAQAKTDVSVGDLGSGSDYTVFLQHLGVPSADMSSTGAYGVYHSAFDNFTWFKKFADPDFLYEQQMARMLGIEVIRISQADVLPYDYEEYGKEVAEYIQAAKKKSDAEFGAKSPNFTDATRAAAQFEQAGVKILNRQRSGSGDATALNDKLRQAERALLIPEGLPGRTWFHHPIYAPGRYTGYAAVVIPGINESIDKHDLDTTRQQLAALTEALKRSANVLESAK